MAEPDGPVCRRWICRLIRARCVNASRAHVPRMPDRQATRHSPRYAVTRRDRAPETRASALCATTGLKSPSRVRRSVVAARALRQPRGGARGRDSCSRIRVNARDARPGNVTPFDERTNAVVGVSIGIASVSAKSPKRMPLNCWCSDGCQWSSSSCASIVAKDGSTCASRVDERASCAAPQVTETGAGTAGPVRRRGSAVRSTPDACTCCASCACAYP